MSHDKIYGTCESKCRHEVYSKEVADSTFLKTTTAPEYFALKNHASAGTAYGIGSSSQYGHVKITGALDVSPSMSTGTALAASAGKELLEDIQYISDQLTTRIIALEQRVRALENAQ